MYFVTVSFIGPISFGIDYLSMYDLLESIMYSYLSSGNILLNATSLRLNQINLVLIPSPVDLALACSSAHTAFYLYHLTVCEIRLNVCTLGNPLHSILGAVCLLWPGCLLWDTPGESLTLQPVACMFMFCSPGCN